MFLQKLEEMKEESVVRLRIEDKKELYKEKKIKDEEERKKKEQMVKKI